MVGAMRPPLPPGPYLVVGLARSGRAAALALHARGAEVAGRDGGRGRRAPPGNSSAAGVAVHGRPTGRRCSRASGSLIKSPGVPQEAAGGAGRPRARRARCSGELELGWRLLPNPVIAITGSNGKTTTTELVGEIHRAAGTRSR